MQQSTDPTAGSAVVAPDVNGRVLIVDPESRSLVSEVERIGCMPLGLPTYSEALQLLACEDFDILIVDADVAEERGRELLRNVRDRWPDLVVIVLSTNGAIASAVEAMKLGAYEYLVKPACEAELSVAIRRGLEHRAILRENRALRRQLEGRFSLDSVVGRTNQMQRVFEFVEAVADTRTTILMHGETGTGKSLLARAIHQRSHRRDRPFIEVSCGAIPETLLASELFGHVKGAFTGALTDKDGKFSAADGGTIFLDEINCASPTLQIKLLRVLQEKKFEPLGSNRTATVDVRVILAANVDLQEEVRAGRFREDLFYRINVVKIELPPLRERLADIPLLAETFLAKHTRINGKTVSGFTDEAMQCMRTYGWPGNVRELENCVERAVVLTRNTRITRQDLPPDVQSSPRDDAGALVFGPDGRVLALKAALAEPERRAILAALRAYDWNRSLAAEALDINRATLYKKMKRLGINPPGGAVSRATTNA